MVIYYSWMVEINIETNFISGLSGGLYDKNKNIGKYSNIQEYIGIIGPLVKMLVT